MTEKWLIAPGEERVIDIASASRLKVGLVGGQEREGGQHQRPAGTACRGGASAAASPRLGGAVRRR